MSTSKKPDKELEFLDSLCKQVEDKTISARLRYLFDWYEEKARANKRSYNFSRTLTYLLPCIITLTSIYIFVFKDHWASTISATISVALAFINHRIDHYRYYENMVRYRNTAEKLKRETELYLNRCGKYESINEDKNRRIFANAIERFAAAELASWENLQAESYQSARPPQSAEEAESAKRAISHAIAEENAEQYKERCQELCQESLRDARRDPKSEE